jgi:hypothetical protein
VSFRIRPLEWERCRPEDPPPYEWWWAKTVLGDIHVECDEEGRCSWRYCFDEYYDEGKHDCDSIVDGKAAAEAFYLERILPALVDADS